MLICGGDAGKRLHEASDSATACRFQVVPVENEIRTNLTITDKHGLTVNLNETGPTLSKAEVARVEKAVKGTLDRASWLMICGSIPPGVPASFYGRLIAAARKKKVKTLLHADGEALRQGIEERPTVATPNQQEAERLLGRTLLTRTHYLEAAERIRTMGPESVVLSLGSRGAVGAFREGMFEALPPRVDAVCPDRRGRRAFGGLYVGDGAQEQWGGSDALGRGGGDRVGTVAGHEVRHAWSRPRRSTSRWNCGVRNRVLHCHVVMLPDLKLVVRLQEIDNRLAELAREIATLPKHIAEIEKKLGAHERKLDADRAALAANQKERKKCETDIPVQEQKISKLKDQMLSTKTNEQYRAFQNEIEFCQKEIRRLEDRILELMAESEPLEKNVKAAEAALKEEKAQVEAEKVAARERTAVDQKASNELLVGARQHRQGSHAGDLHAV